MKVIKKIKEQFYKLWFMYHNIRFGYIVRKPCEDCGRKNYYDISGLNINEETRFLCKECFDKDLLNGETVTK